MPMQPILFTCNSCDQEDLTESQVERFVDSDYPLDEINAEEHEEAYLCIEKCIPAWKAQKAQFGFVAFDPNED